MPSPLDPQLDAVLAALAARLGSGVEDAIFVGQDDLPHGQGALIEPLLRCGLLIPAQPAKATICEGCERCCIMAVQFRAAPSRRVGARFHRLRQARRYWPRSRAVRRIAAMDDLMAGHCAATCQSARYRR